MDLWTSIVFNLMNNKVEKLEEIFESNKFITASYLNKVHKHGNTLIGMAVINGNIPIVKLLLKYGSRTETKVIYDQWGPFENTCAPVLFHAVDEIESGSSKLSKLLLRHGSNIDSRDSLGQSLLHIACSQGKIKTVQFLLRHKIDVNACDNRGRTVLMTALQYYDPKVTKLLLKHKPKIHLKDNKGRNILHFCNRIGECPHLFKWFIYKGVKLCKDHKGVLPLIENAHRHTSIIQFFMKSKHISLDTIIEYQEKALANNIIGYIDSTLPLQPTLHAQRSELQRLIRQREEKSISIDPNKSIIAKAIGVQEIICSDSPRIFGNVEFVTLQAFFYLERIIGFEYFLIANILEYCLHCESLNSTQQFKLCNTIPFDFKNIGPFTNILFSEHTSLLSYWFRQEEFLSSIDNLLLQDCLLNRINSLLTAADNNYVKGFRRFVASRTLEQVTKTLGLLLLLQPEKSNIQTLKSILSKISDFCFKRFKSDYLQSILLAQRRTYRISYFIANPDTTRVIDFLLILLGSDVALVRNKSEFLIHSAAKIDYERHAKLMVSKLIDSGCHQDTRDSRGYTYSDILKARGIENQHEQKSSLQCLTARVITTKSVDYSPLPKALQTFVELH